VDTGVEEAGEVSQFYDPMIAKLIVHAETREEAAEALAEAAAEVEVWPVKTNAGFIVRCLEHPRFRSGDVDTGFIAAEEATLTDKRLSPHGLQGAARVIRFEDGAVGRDPFAPWESWGEAAGLRLNAGPSLRQTVFVDSVRTVIEIDDDAFAHHGHFEPEHGVTIYFESGTPFRVSSKTSLGGTSGPASDGSLRAPMPGKIVATPAKPGDVVTKGQPVVVLEAMKMEHALVAPFDGVVGEIGVSVGDQVVADAVLAVVTAAEK